MTKPTSHQRGYNHTHKLIRQRLIARMKDGEPCWWCNQPMYENKTRNWDGLPLAADHEQPHGARNKQHATRLLHFTCNSQRQDGSRDHLRPALVNKEKPQTANPFGW